MEIDETKIASLLELYAEKVNDGQRSMAFGIRCAVKHLGIVTDEQIQDVLDPVAAKARARKERKAIKNMLEPIEGEEKPKKERRTKRK
jgi:hypothetical protein